MDLFSRMPILTFYEDLFLRLPNMCSCNCEKTKNSFKITEAEIDINQYRVCKRNFFSHVKPLNASVALMQKPVNFSQFLYEGNTGI